MEQNMHLHLDPSSIEPKVLLMVVKLLLDLALPLHLKDMELALLTLRVGLDLDLVKPLLLFQMLVVNQWTMLQ